MAAASTFSFGKGLVFIGDAGGSEVFATPCAIVSGGISYSKATNEVVIPDCGDPDAPGWTERDATAFSASITASGLATTTGIALLEAAYLATASRNMRFHLVGAGSGGATPDKQHSGAFHITSYSLKGARGDKWEFEFEASSDGAVAIASVAALA